MNKTRQLSTAVWLALTLFALAGCEVGTSFFLLSVDGKVVNARAAANSSWYNSGAYSLVGAEVVLTNTADGKQYYGSVSSSGHYSIANVPFGRYTMKGRQSGWIAVPRTIDISGFASTLPDLLMYRDPGASQILLITEWEDQTIDVDMHMIITTSENLVDPKLDPTYGTPCGDVYYGVQEKQNVKLERDVTPAMIASGQPAVETMLISANPFGLGESGWLRLYLRANAPSGSLTGNSFKNARPTVHVMQGSAHLGTYYLPVETNETAICVLKIKVTSSGSVTYYDVMSPGNYNNLMRSSN